LGGKKCLILGEKPTFQIRKNKAFQGETAAPGGDTPIPLATSGHQEKKKQGDAAKGKKEAIDRSKRGRENRRCGDVLEKKLSAFGGESLSREDKPLWRNGRGVQKKPISRLESPRGTPRGSPPQSTSAFLWEDPPSPRKARRIGEGNSASR